MISLEDKKRKIYNEGITENIEYTTYIMLMSDFPIDKCGKMAEMSYEDDITKIFFKN